jgi:hypothetical protein
MNEYTDAILERILCNQTLLLHGMMALLHPEERDKEAELSAKQSLPEVNMTSVYSISRNSFEWAINETAEVLEQTNELSQVQ